MYTGNKGECPDQAILKSCVRIVCLLFFVICGGVVLLFGGMAVHYCCTGRFENRVASLKDFVAYILFSGAKRNSWKFTPGYFDFVHTNQTYAVEFCPRLAGKHDIYFTYDNFLPQDSNRAEKLMKGVALQIAIYHVQSGVLHEKVARIGLTTLGYEQLVTPIYTFSTADLPWKYTDRLRIEIAPLALNVRREELDDRSDKVELMVCESVPFY